MARRAMRAERVRRRVLRSAERLGRIEWPTLAVAVGVYGGWLATVLTHRLVPAPVTVALLGVLGAWHTSLQHEIIHGHPFRRRGANELLAAVPLTWWLPYRDYRDTHLAHHRDADLTDPDVDPESTYVTASRWDVTGGAARAVRRVLHTLAGRVVLGPLVDTARYWVAVTVGGRRGPRSVRAMAEHAVGLVPVVAVVTAAGLPAWQCALGSFYLGRSLSLVRSFAEHRWVPGDASRSAVVRAGRFWSLLFLNNNLHHTHHARPGAPWYRLPLLADALDSDTAAAAGAGRYAGYREVARRYGVRSFDGPVHPASVPTRV